MNRTQIQLTDSQFKALKELSAAENKSMAELIRQAVDSLLHNQPRPGPDKLKQRAIAIAGQFHSGVQDLSTNHDRYLGEAFSDDDLR
jgi:hypothetical protein